MANEIKQTMLNPPFGWPWNRVKTTFSATAGTQDYSTALADFGWLEQASFTGADGKTFQANFIKNVLTADSNQSRPTMISPLIDDNAGNITFRLTPVPLQNYTVNIIYQKLPTLFTSTLSTTWAPIPDRYLLIYTQGFKALSLLYKGDERWVAEYQQFLKSLVGVSEGLDEDQKALFVSNMLQEKIQAAQALGKLGGR